MDRREVSARFDCFGSSCAAFVTGDCRDRSAREAVELVRARLRAWHERFSRFLPDSELSRLNEDPRREVPVSPPLARLAQAVGVAARASGGLVDATLVQEIRAAGYAADLGERVPLSSALALAPARRPASAADPPRWQDVEVDLQRCIVARPPGVKLDSGGLAKGLFADLLAGQLAGHAGFAIDCAGDLAIGGAAAIARTVDVESPFDGETLHSFSLRSGGVATSGIGRRSWLDREGRPAHHLLDPATGRPAFTGVVQATALAADALTAEMRAKAAILSGPRGARAWLAGGGVIVLDDGSHEVVEPPAEVTLDQLAVFARGSRAPAPKGR